MAKNAKTPVIKARETKLSKKSVEELIDIILRKDSVERKLNTQIISLKSEVNDLNSRMENAIKDMNGTLSAFNETKEKLTEANKAFDTLVKNYELVSKENDSFRLTISGYKIMASILGAVAIISTLGWLFC